MRRWAAALGAGLIDPQKVTGSDRKAGPGRLPIN
jgi:hypothetical protein